MLTQTSESISDLAHRLNSQDTSTREQAQDDLRILIAADVGRLGRIQSAMGGGVALSLLLFVPVYVYEQVTGHHGMRDFITGVMTVYLAVVFLLPLLQRRTARRILALDMPQVIGPLSDVQATGGMFRGGMVRATLICLLPRLQSSDANLLTTRQRKSLNRFLSSDEYWPFCGRFYGADLKIAILQALEQVGDKTALPAVEQLARLAHNPQVRLAAQECLPFLQQRTDQARVENTLLRASGPGVSPDVLLRPASDGEETAPQHLALSLSLLRLCSLC